jgi:hypothetical protein
MPGVNERELVVGDEERVRADEPHRVQPFHDLHAVILGADVPVAHHSRA